MSNFLITGGSGLLGVNWAAHMNGVHSINLGIHSRKIEISNASVTDVDLESVSAISRVLEALDIDTVVNCAAMTGVEDCELAPELANHVNVKLATNVAMAAKGYGAKLVQISSDHLFDGSSRMMTENDLVMPINVYAKTKANAEAEVLSILPSALVIRTNFYGWGTSYRTSFSDAILASLRANRAIKLFDDIFYSPILIDVLVDAIHILLQKGETGVFNIAGDQRLSKFDFGREVAAVYGFNPALIGRDKFSNRPDLVRRPFEMSLSTKKICSILGHQIGGVREHLIRMSQISRRPQALTIL